MKAILSFTSLAFSVLLASAAMYEGDYLLTELYNENHVAVAIPSDQDFRLSLVSDDVTNQQGSMSSSYSFRIKIGNSMGASMTVTDESNTSVKFGPVVATRMMPPPELFKVENGLFQVLPEASSIKLNDGVLTLEGAKGGVVFTAV